MTGFKFLGPESSAVKSCAGLWFETRGFSQVWNVAVDISSAEHRWKVLIRSKSLLLGKFFHMLKTGSANQFS